MEIPIKSKKCGINFGRCIGVVLARRVQFRASEVAEVSWEKMEEKSGSGKRVQKEFRKAIHKW